MQIDGYPRRLPPKRAGKAPSGLLRLLFALRSEKTELDEKAGSGITEKPAEGFKMRPRSFPAKLSAASESVRLRLRAETAAKAHMLPQRQAMQSDSEAAR